DDGRCKPLHASCLHLVCARGHDCDLRRRLRDERIREIALTTVSSGLYQRSPTINAPQGTKPAFCNVLRLGILFTLHLAAGTLPPALQTAFNSCTKYVPRPIRRNGSAIFM